MLNNNNFVLWQSAVGIQCKGGLITANYNKVHFNIGTKLLLTMGNKKAILLNGLLTRSK